MQLRAKNEKPRLGSEIVELSGESKYPADSIYYALREYVANSIDAIQAFERFNDDNGFRLSVDRTIEIFYDGDTLHIFDKGVGIDRESLLKFTDLCSSEKDSQYDVGRFGFGSHAGGAIADKAIISGKTYNSPQVFIGSIDFGVIRQNRLRKGGPNFISDATELLEAAITEEVAEHKRSRGTHFAHLALRLRDDFREAWDENDARLFLGQYCPVDFDPNWTNNNGEPWGNIIKQELPDDTIMPVNIFLNGEPIYKPYIHKQLKGIEVVELYAGGNSGKLLARCWYAQTTVDKMIGKRGTKDDPRRKLSLYLNGMMIDTIRRDYLESECSITNSDHLRHFVGEIYIVDGKGIVPHDVKISITGGEDWEDLKEQISQLLKNLVRRRNQTSFVRNAIPALDGACDFVSNVNSQTIPHLPTLELYSLLKEYDDNYKIFSQYFGIEKTTKSGQERASRKKFNDHPRKKRRYEQMLDKLIKDRQAIRNQLEKDPAQAKFSTKDPEQTDQTTGVQSETSTEPPGQPRINEHPPSSIKAQPQSNGKQKGSGSQKTTQSTSELNFNIPARDIFVLVEKVMMEVGVDETTVQQAIDRLKQELPSKAITNA